MGEQFGAIISALYTLFHENDDGHEEWNAREYISDEEHVIHTVVTKVDWDNEGDVVEIIMSRNYKDDIDYENDIIEIEIKNYDEGLKSIRSRRKICAMRLQKHVPMS